MTVRRFFNHPYYIFAELLVFFIALPSVIIFGRLAPWMFTFLWAGGAYCFLIYRYVMCQDQRGRLWHLEALSWPHIRHVVLRWVIACAGMVAFLYWYDASRLMWGMSIPPERMAMIFLLYPVLSALPQEFIYCSFFFRRYGHIFKSNWAMVWASALLFAYAHCLYINPVAPGLGVIAGLIFASTYVKTRSLALVSIEHGLYGNALFFIGLGYYFFSGAVPTQ